MNSVCAKRKRALQEGSLDQYYTRKDVVRFCVGKICEFAASRGVALREVIDFSGGDCYFERCLRECVEDSTALKITSYDVMPTEEAERLGCIRKDWFRVAPRTHTEVSLIGFNPPFGHHCTMLKKFLEHAATFKPRLLAVVHPFTRKVIFPAQYSVAHTEKLQSRPFYFPKKRDSPRVSNCWFTVLERRAADVPLGPRKSVRETEVTVLYVKPISRTRKWEDYFTRGFAVRRVGYNAGKQVIVVGRHISSMIDKRGCVQPWSPEQASRLAFHTFATDFQPTLPMAFCLWRQLQAVMLTREQGIVPTVNRAVVLRCIQGVLVIKNDEA